MSDFWQSLGSSAWWISVVVVGVAINIVSSYAKTGLDRILSSFSIWWRNRSAQRQAIYESEIAALVGSTSKQNAAKHRVIVLKLEGIFGLLLAILLTFIKVFEFIIPELNIARSIGFEPPAGLFYLIIMIVLLGSFRISLRGDYLDDQLQEAERRESPTS